MEGKKKAARAGAAAPKSPKKKLVIDHAAEGYGYDFVLVFAHQAGASEMTAEVAEVAEATEAWAPTLPLLTLPGAKKRPRGSADVTLHGSADRRPSAPPRRAGPPSPARDEEAAAATSRSESDSSTCGSRSGESSTSSTHHEGSGLRRAMRASARR